MSNKTKALLIGILIGATGTYFSTSNDKTNSSATMNISQDLAPRTEQLAENITLAPVSHASAILNWNDQLLFIDLVGEPDMYKAAGSPDVVFVTHRHPDHLDEAVLEAVLTEDTIFYTTSDVRSQLPDTLAERVTEVVPNQSYEAGRLTFNTIPAYNLRDEAQDFHPQGRGDVGFVIDDGETRVYFSGDTEGVPEMLALEDIDAAFVAMNLPFTMSVEDAAEAVVAFAPQTVYPYHFRGREGFSDLERFTELVQTENPNISVQVLDWYDEEAEEN